MQTGVVMRFNKVKGYGFIKPDQSEKEIFVHFTQIQAEGYKELIEGQRVSFKIEKGDKGDFAAEVTVL